MIAPASLARQRIATTFKEASSFAIPVRPRPLAALNMAMCLLDATAAQVRGYLDCGKLAGFNIATEPGSRACLRVLHASIDHFSNTGGKKPYNFDWPALFNLVWPFKEPNISGVDLTRALNCDHGHIENLINARLFHVVKKARPGPDGSPIVTLASFEAFLKGRLL